MDLGHLEPYWGKFVEDQRVPVGEIRMGSWDGPTLIKNIGASKMTNPITPLTPAQTASAESQVTKEGYLEKDLIGLDQFANVLTDGSPDETISSRMARWDTEDKGFKHAIGAAISSGLDIFQKDHGANAEAGDLQRAETVARIEESTDDLNEGSD